jgi:DNA-binding LytR/AlgR family response regulator
MTNSFSMNNETQKLRCLIVDDEHIAIKGIVNYIEKLEFLTVMATASSAIEAAEKLKKEDIDLMFLDINMPDLSGLEFLETLEKAPMTIITTAYSEYALEGFRLNVVDYLMKPISFQRFFTAVSKARDRFTSSITFPAASTGNETAYIRQGDHFRRIAFADILYIEGMQNYLKLFFKDETLIIHQTMSQLEENLPANLFIRNHRSFITNVNHIKSVSGGRIYIGDTELPISKQRREELLTNIVYKNLLSK